MTAWIGSGIHIANRLAAASDGLQQPQSAQGYEDALHQAIERTAHTIRNIRSNLVKEFEAIVAHNQVCQFRCIVKISSLPDEGAGAA